LPRAARTRRLAALISMLLASQTVQVTTEASASRMSTDFTTGSALRYMPQGVRSRGSVVAPITLSASSASAAIGTSQAAITATVSRG
jgi:hypothetical protein